MVPNGNNGVGAERVDLVIVGGVVAAGGESVIRFTTVGFDFRVFCFISLTDLLRMGDIFDVGM